MSRGLFDALFFQDGLAPINLVSPAAVTTITGNPSRVTTAGGPGTKTDHTDYVAITSHGSYIAGDFTASCHFVSNTFPSGISCLFAKDDGTNSELDVFFDTGHQTFVIIGNTNDGNAYATGFGNGTLNHYAITRLSNATTYYANGSVIGTSSVAGTTVAVNPMKFGSRTSVPSQAGNNSYLAFASWLRALSAAEIRLLSVNPYYFTVTEPTIFQGSLPPALMAQICM